MVIRRVVGGKGAAPSLRSSVAASLLLCTALFAQEPGTPSSSESRVGGNAGEQPAAEVEKPSKDVSPKDVAPMDVVYGKVVPDKVRLHCWASAVASPPQFEDALEKDMVVQLGRSENGFRQVILPHGPIGYISKRFAKENEDGTVVTDGTKVAFRYRPRTSEAPVAQLPDGTAVHVIGGAPDDIADSWYRVRVPGIDAWLAAADVQVVDATDPKVVAAYEALGDKMMADAQQRLAGIAAEQARRKQAQIDLEAVKVVEAAFATEMQKPVSEQDYAPLKTALDKAAESMAEDSGARDAVAALEKRIETQSWIVEASKVAKEEPPKADQPIVEEAPTDRLERFESIGWLRYERRLAGPGVFYLEKGGRRMFDLSCTTGRYDLSLFVGREVGVIGPRRTPSHEAMSVLDIERLEVLGTR